MSYKIRYKAEYKNKKNEVITVNLYKRDYTGSVIALENIQETVTLKYRPSEDNAVIGSELSFSFITKNKATFSDLMTSNYKDFKAEFLINSVKKWTGFLVIDNITTSYFDYAYTYNLSFADSLAELDRYTVTNDKGGEIAGNNSLLWYVKNSVKHTELNLDFAVVLNTKEANLMTLPTDNALAKATLPADRFKEINSGNKEIKDAKSVINEVLKPFNCKLFQANNKFYIVNDLEINSTIYYYSYSDLSLQSTATNNSLLDISAKKFDRANQLMMDRPLKNVKVKYLNKNIPQNLIPNAEFSDTDTSFWAFQNGGMWVMDGELNIEAGHIEETNYQSGVLTGNPISVSQKTNNDVIRVEFDYRLIDIWVGGVKDTGLEQTVDYVAELNVQLMQGTTVIGTQTRTFGKNTTRFKHDFPVVGSGMYHLVISDRSNSMNKYDRINYRYDNFSFLPMTLGDNGANGATVTTFDELYSTTNTGNKAIDIEDELELIVGDGMQLTDISNLRIGNDLTAKWKSYNRSENCKLQQLYTVNLLRLRQRYRNNLTITVIADDFASINYNQHIVFDGKKYVITDYTANYSTITNSYNLRLVELFNDDISYEFSAVTLSSVDGQKPASEMNISETDPTVPLHVKAIKLSDIDKWNNNTGGITSVSWADILNKPTTFAPATHSHSWSSITSKPTTFTPSAHTHAISDVVNLSTELANKADKEHTHDFLTPLQIAQGYANINHTHTLSQIADFDVNNFAPAIHNHSASEITSGSFSVSRGGTGLSSLTSGSYLVGNGTGAVTLRTPAQVLTNIGAASATLVTQIQQDLANKADKEHSHSWYDLREMPAFSVVGHTHTWGEVSDKPLFFNPVQHSHEMTDILGLDVALSAKASSTHSHSATDITSGTLSVSRGGLGRSTLTANAFLTGNGTSAVNMLTPAQVLTAIGATTEAWVTANFLTPGQIAQGYANINHTHTLSQIIDFDANNFASATHTHAYSSLTGIPSSFTPSAHTHTEIVPLTAYTIGTATATPRSFGTGLKHGFVRDTNGYPIVYGKLTSFGSYTTSQDGGQFQILSPYSDVAGYNEGKPMYRMGYHDNRGWSAWKTFASEDWVTANFLTPLQAATGYANINHTHTLSQIIDFDANNFASAVHNHSAANITSGTLVVSRGGIGLSSVVKDNFLVGNGTSAMVQKTPAEVRAMIGAVDQTWVTNNFLTPGQAATGYANINHTHSASEIVDLDTSVFARAVHNHSATEITSGIFSVARGGTGLSSLVSGSYLRGNGTSAVTMRTPAQVLSDIGAASATHSHSDLVTLDTAQTITGAKTFTSDISVVKNNAWLSLDSLDTGDNIISQGAGISIGESGYKGEAAVHLTYTGDGWSNLGMGIVSTTTGRPAFNVLRMFWQSTTAYFQGDITAGGQVTAFSDAKLKTNIRDYEGGLEKVLMLRAKTYERIDLDNKEECGFIAQDVQRIEPDLVKDNDGTLSLDYSRMVVMLTKAVQQQQQQIEELKAALKGGGK